MYICIIGATSSRVWGGVGWGGWGGLARSCDKGRRSLSQRSRPVALRFLFEKPWAPMTGPLKRS